jgi:hypothetical protein
MKAAEPEIMRGVSKGVLHKNTGARKVARLTKRVTKLGKELNSVGEFATAEISAKYAPRFIVSMLIFFIRLRCCNATRSICHLSG